MHPIHHLLVTELEAAADLNGDYVNLKNITFASAGTGRRGAMSIVFSAEALLDNRPVALKFIDPEDVIRRDKVASETFDREYSILELLQANPRCITLASTLETYDLNVPAPTGAIPIAISYYATEWLDGDIDDFDFNQSGIDAEEKLKTFREVLLAVEAIHGLGVFHRDIKIDNFRLRQDKQKNLVVLIDFGIAVRESDPPVAPDYPRGRGAGAYKPPEYFVGFNMSRDLALHGDIYALGALLFQFFNSRHFAHVRSVESNFRKVLSAIAIGMAGARDESEKLKIWSKMMRVLRQQLDSPKLDGPGNTLPLGAGKLVCRAYERLVCFDFRNRVTDLSVVRKDIESAIKMLSNHRMESEARALRKEMRARKLAKLERRRERAEQQVKGLEHA